MACYLISYDLRKPNRNYDALYAAIKAYRTWAHIHESVWAIVTENTATQVRDYLLQHLDADDRVFVIRSGTESAWKGVLCKNEWLKDHL